MLQEEEEATTASMGDHNTPMASMGDHNTPMASMGDRNTPMASMDPNTPVSTEDHKSPLPEPEHTSHHSSRENCLDRLKSGKTNLFIYQARESSLFPVGFLLLYILLFKEKGSIKPCLMDFVLAQGF